MGIDRKQENCHSRNENHYQNKYHAFYYILPHNFSPKQVKWNFTISLVYNCLFYDHVSENLLKTQDILFLPVML